VRQRKEVKEWAYGNRCDIWWLDDGLGDVGPDLLGQRAPFCERRVVGRYRHQGRVPPGSRIGLLKPHDQIVKSVENRKIVNGCDVGRSKRG